ncbi:MAG: AAA family ATPase [Verrucomicrobia bacterium]|nr:AAA family ATPase [Verrucomicrobiota bacterium]
MSTTANPDLSNPFPGLRCFQSTEDYLFFGRQEQIEDLLRRLRENRLAAVVGTSGSGKSSLVRAGLLPAIQGGGMSQAGSNWEIAVMRPGGSPLAQLADALCEAGLYDPDAEDAQFHLQATLTRSRNGLVEALRQSQTSEDSRLLLVVDQFEELFRFNHASAACQEESVQFVNLLLHATQQPELRIYVVLTMRSDFLGECSQFLGLAEAVNEGEFLIPRMTRDQIQQAIEGPIRVCGASIAPRLLFRLLNDVEDNQDQLPVLQHALMRTWDLWKTSAPENPPLPEQSDRPLDLEHYEATGGMHQALSRHADEVFAALPSDAHRTAAARIFQALTERGSDGRGIRRPTRLNELVRIAGVEAHVAEAVIEAYRAPGVTFLMPPAGVPLVDSTVIDISHESLMRVWVRLRGWVEEEAQSVGIYHRLTESAALHEVGKAGLYRDPELGIALAWRQETRPNAAWADQYGGRFDRAMAYLEHSRTEAGREEQEREAARQRELQQARALAEQQRLRVEEQQRAAVRMKWLMRGMGAVALVALACFFMATAARRTAVENATEAENLKTKALRDFYGASLLKASFFLNEGNGGRANEALDACPPELRNWEWGKLKFQADQSRVLAEGLDQLQAAVFSPDGTRILSTQGNGMFQLWDAASGQHLWTIDQETASTGFRAIAEFSADGSMIVTPGGTNLCLRDARTGNPIEWVNGVTPITIRACPSALLALVMTNQTFRILDLTNRRVHATLAESPFPREFTNSAQTDVRLRAAFSPDGRRLATSGMVPSVFRRKLVSMTLWDVASGRRILDIPTDLANLNALDFTPSGNGIVGCDSWALLQICDTTTGNVTREFRDHSADVTAFGFTGDNGRIVSGDSRSRLMVADVSTGRLLGTLDGHSANIRSIRLGPNGRQLVTTSDDGTIRLWSPDPEPNPLVLDHLPGYNKISSVTFSPDAKRLISTCRDPAAPPIVWDVATGEKLFTLTGHTNVVQQAAYRPDGKQMVTLAPGTQAEIKLWDAETGRFLHNLAGTTNGVYHLAYTPDGQQLAAADGEGRIHFWNGQTGQETRVIDRPDSWTSGVGGMAFSPDGTRIAVSDFGGTGEVVVLDAATGRPWKTLHGSIKSRLSRPAYSPDGKYVAVAVEETNDVLLWDLNLNTAPRRLRRHSENVHSLVFSPDSRRLFTGGGDDTLRVWDIELGEELLFFDPGQWDVLCLDVSGDGKTIATGGELGTVRIWKTARTSPQNRQQTLESLARKATRIDPLIPQENWPAITNHLVTAVWSDVSNGAAWWRAAMALTLAGDSVAFEALTPRFLEQYHRSTSSSELAFRLAALPFSTFLPGANALPGMADVFHQSRNAVGAMAESFRGSVIGANLFALRALADYRTGDFSLCSTTLQEARQRPCTDSGWTPALIHGLAAMLAHHNGDAETARQSLAELTLHARQMQERLRTDFNEGLADNWMLTELLRREAASLIDANPDDGH